MCYTASLLILPQQAQQPLRRFAGGHASRSPALAQHVLLPALHILLDAMGVGADALRGRERTLRSQPDATPESPQPAISPASASSSSAAVVGSPGLSPSAGVVSPDGVQREASSRRRGGRASEGALDQSTPQQQVLVSFSDFMRGRAGLADYLARRATSAAADSKTADAKEDSRVQQLMLKCARKR